ncbi:ABC transporter ATP-binding protein [Geodermatophilus aquaeductus]|uniref:Amino acid/amide ABC transporter ATP-binding protein 1, HAAT family n=1 Tax=Geodermatophilus aquaeductus TaxID=1564161 RepID=A0A521FEL4_9ACTN|nr:ABC transporter ATP-binding protein [Geodermatophilus aquaeductus]SMO94613.1 amino acid/amide ABC transporter ATP-binding protein 1, HAAT family [Geodermatophilus aquaeductus]
MSTPVVQTDDAGTAGTAPVLELRDVAVHFGGVKAVDGISLQLEPGRIYGIIGPNGSGKSTLIAGITRLTGLTRGELLLDGQPVHDVAPSRLAGRGVARTFQTVRLLADLTVRANVQIGADARADGGRSRRGPTGWLRPGATSPAVADAIARTRLEGFEDHYPAELSYGTQRRVEIARAIAMGPRLLLLDEPTAGMNQTERAEISALMRSMRTGGLCQLLVEHDVQMMIDTCDYVFAMNSGRLIAQGAPAEVVRDPAVQEAYLGRKWREHADGD